MNKGNERPNSWPNDPLTNVALAREFGLSEEEWQSLLAHLERQPTYAELGVVSVMWSEHCSYKSSRMHLARLPTKGPQVVQGPGENAGAVDIGDGYCAVFKMESHNHPSYIEPYQGAATGVGGILRDVFTMGARPVASLNSLRFGRPNHPKTPHLLRGVVAGIAGYGNSIGVPTVGGEVQFDASYDGNILVNAFTVGIAKSSELFFGRADGVGNTVLYVGSKTGRDGIHGATMASAEFSEDVHTKLPTVQVGDPFMEKLLLEACMEIFASGALEGVQDMGAAGLTSSSVEMADRAGNGIELDLDAIPRRTQGLSPYEMLLSESQERMLMVAKRGRENDVLEICRKWDLDAALVGCVTNTGRFVCKATLGFDPLSETPRVRDPKIVVDLPISVLTHAAPKYDRPQKAPLSSETITALAEAHLVAAPKDVGADILRLIGSPNLGSRAWIYRQYDHIVRDGTVLGPGAADAAIVRVFCGEGRDALRKYIALSCDCNGRHLELDPYHGAAMAVAECARNIVCTGSKPLGLTDCLNFASPENPETMWRFARAIDGIAAACTALNTPVVSGNVSFYNETNGKPIVPTPTVAIVGQLQDPEKRITLAFKNSEDVLAILGAPAKGLLAGSEWLLQSGGRLSGEGLRIDLDAEKNLQAALLEMAHEKLLASAHDISDGGLAICLAESCIANGLGARVELPSPLSLIAAHAQLFSEEPTRIVISNAKENLAAIQRIAQKHQVPCALIGSVASDQLDISGVCKVSVASLKQAYDQALSSIVG